MSPSRRAAALAALTLAAACADRPSPVGPDGTAPPSASPEATATADPATRARHERFARRLALALRDDAFRAEVYRATSTSTVREGKVHFQAFLTAGGGDAARRLAALSGEAEAGVLADLSGAEPIELYLPVPAHRTAWQGGTEVLVATAELDTDRPVAFDLWGRRSVLSSTQLPPEPVLALGRAEARFGQTANAISCDECFYEGDEGSGGWNPDPDGPSLATVVSPGLYMTYAKFTQTFEGWLKGSPEFETHILGQDGTSDAMKSYQCAGEHAGGPYAYDQNNLTWTGRVLLFSQAQFDAYRRDHPGRAYRVFVVEDDDTACDIKVDSGRFEQVITEVEAGIGPISGGIDSTLSIGRTFRAAKAGFKILKTIWSWITTQDDIVGNAVEDVVAGEYAPGANWIVKADKNITNGAIRLELVNP